MSDLLKQAIADAKAVRATALSNAKAALEEHFAPTLESMLSEKLKAELGEEEAAAPDAVPAEPAPAPTDAAAAPAPAPHADAAQDAAMGAAAPAPAPAPAPAADAVPSEEPLPMEEEGIEETIAELEDELEENTDNQPGTANAGNPNPLAEGEKASSNYKAKTKGHKTDNKGQEVKDATKLATPGTGGKAVSTKRTAADKYDGAGTQQKGGPVKDMHNKAPKTDNKGQEVEQAVGMDTPGGPLKENEMELDETSLDEILKELESGLNEVGMEELAAPMESECSDEQNPVADGQGETTDEVINLEELLSEISDEKDEIEEAKGGKDDDDAEDDKPAFLKENISLKKELAEYRSAVIFLRDRINEINLLNAKLLYTNKLFKGANLSTSQKLKVIESFDLTKSVREAKLVYATLAESINSGAKKTVTTPAPVKKQVTGTVKTITEGLASKPVASTKPTTATVITEGSDLANRFKKLAGIRK